jgi:hypothetical protein
LLESAANFSKIVTKINSAGVLMGINTISNELQEDKALIQAGRNYLINRVTSVLLTTKTLFNLGRVIVPAAVKSKISADVNVFNSAKHYIYEHKEEIHHALFAGDILANISKSAKVFNIFHLLPKAEPYFNKIIILEVGISIGAAYKAAVDKKFREIPSLALNMAAAYGVTKTYATEVPLVLIAQYLPEIIHYAYKGLYNQVLTEQKNNDYNKGIMGLGY